MPPLSAEHRFRTRVVLQTACPSRYALMAGRAVPLPEGAGLQLDFPADTAEGWPELVTAMQDAARTWPPLPLHLIVQGYRIHPVDSSARSFTEALAGALHTLWGAAVPGILAPSRWCRVEVLPMPTALPAGVQALADAGHCGQAVEVVRALGGAPVVLRRLLLEGVLSVDHRALEALAQAALGPRFEAVLAELLQREGPWLLAVSRSRERTEVLRSALAGVSPPAGAVILRLLLGSVGGTLEEAALCQRLIDAVLAEEEARGPLP